MVPRTCTDQPMVFQVPDLTLPWFHRTTLRSTLLWPPLHASSSADEAQIPEASSPVLDYFKVYQELLWRMKAALGIQMALVEENTQKLIDILHPAVAGKVALPKNDAIMHPIKALWQTPFSIPKEWNAVRFCPRGLHCLTYILAGFASLWLQ